MPKVFAFTSWGNAGVPWIMECLNAHPQVRVYSNLRHAFRSPLQREAPVIDYLDAIGRFNWFERLLAGDMHGVSPHELPSLHEAFGESFRGAHLMGHPIQRLAGSIYYSRDAGRDWRFKDFLAIWNVPRDDPDAQRAFALLGEDGDYVPANYMLHVNNVTVLHSVAGPKLDPFFSLEALLSSDDAWDALISHLSGGEIPTFGDHWRQFQGAVPNIAHEPFTATPRQVWDNFDAYVKRYVAASFTEEARAVYESLGYDLSFVR